MNICLYGFMGSGKTTVGGLISKWTGLKLVDVDQVVEEALGMSVERVFQVHGEEWFRLQEAQAARVAAQMEGVVIACGGGTILEPGSLEALRKSSHMVYLKVSPQVAVERVRAQGGRPLLTGDLLAAAEKLLEERRGAYLSAAEVVVETDGKTPGQVAREVLEGVGWL